MAQFQLKPAWFDEANIRAHLESEYVLGKEKRPQLRNWPIYFQVYYLNLMHN
jgi:hypothetical protein